MMFLNVFDGNRAKCAKSHMQKNINNINPFFRYARKQLIGKVQPGSRSSSRSVFFCVNRLITGFIIQSFRNVRRERHLARSIENFFKNSVVIQPDNSVPVFTHFCNGCRKFIADFERQPNFCTSSGFHKAFPMFFIDSAKQQKLHFSACFGTCAVKPCRNNPRCVANKNIPGIEIVYNV